VLYHDTSIYYSCFFVWAWLFWYYRVVFEWSVFIFHFYYIHKNRTTLMVKYLCAFLRVTSNLTVFFLNNLLIFYEVKKQWRSLLCNFLFPYRISQFLYCIEAHSQGCISVFKENVISIREGAGSVENHFN